MFQYRTYARASNHEAKPLFVPRKYKKIKHAELSTSATTTTMTATTAMRTKKNVYESGLCEEKTCEYFYRCDNLLYRQLHMFCIRRFVVCLLFFVSVSIWCARAREPVSLVIVVYLPYDRIQCVCYKSVAAITFHNRIVCSIWSRGVLDFVQLKRTCEKETIFSSSIPNRAFQKCKKKKKSNRNEKQQFGTIKI